MTATTVKVVLLEIRLLTYRNLLIRILVTTVVVIIIVILLVILEVLLQLNPSQPSTCPRDSTSEADVYRSLTKIRWLKGSKNCLVVEDRLSKRFRVLV